jgi:hypothetical protein
MSLYRIYIDEVGNHDLIHADDPNQYPEPPNQRKTPLSGRSDGPTAIHLQ